MPCGSGWRQGPAIGSSAGDQLMVPRRPGRRGGAGRPRGASGTSPSARCRRTAAASRCAALSVTPGACGGQLGGQRHRVERRVQPRRPEHADRLPGGARAAHGQHPVHGGHQVAVRGHLQHLPDVDHERARRAAGRPPSPGPAAGGPAGRRCESCSSSVRNPQSACGPDPLRVRAVGVAADVADELAEPVRLAGERGVEVVLGQARAQAASAWVSSVPTRPSSSPRPARRGAAPAAAASGHWLGPSSSRNGASHALARHRRALGGEVELLAGVGRPAVISWPSRV